MNKHHPESNFTAPWIGLQDKYNLSDRQIDQLKRYAELLIEWNSKFNLTAITDIEGIIQHHFDDSFALSHHINFTDIQSAADIGTGAGFPGLALKILYPHLTMILIEVNGKKRDFLHLVAQELGLTNVITYGNDWRTFLRTNNYRIDYFFARASLQPEELLRLFKPSSAYKNATLVYWASQHWVPEKLHTQFVEKEVVYTLNAVQRKYLFFKQK